MSAKRITALENRLKTQKKSPRQSQPAFRKQQAVLRRQIAQLKAELPKRAKSSPPPTQRKAKTPRQLREARAERAYKAALANRERIAKKNRAIKENVSATRADATAAQAKREARTRVSAAANKQDAATAARRSWSARELGVLEGELAREQKGRIRGADLGTRKGVRGEAYKNIKRTTPEQKQQAADLTGLGLEVASYGLGAGQMIGLIRGAATIGAKFLTPKAVAKTGQKEAVKLANRAARRANRKKAAAETTATKPKPADAKPASVPKGKAATKPKSAAAKKGAATRKANKAKAAEAAAKKKAADARASTRSKVAAGSAVAALTAGLVGSELAQDRPVTSSTSDTKKQGPKRGLGGRGSRIEEKSGKSLAMKSPPRVGGIGDFPIEPWDKAGQKVGEPVERQGAAKKITSKPSVSEPAKQVRDAKKAADAKKNEAARAKREEAKGKGRSWKEGLDPITAKVEELLGLKRTAKEIKDDMKVTEDLEKELGFSGGKKRGGRVYSPPRKKYAMNRGGMASLRKPTRA